MLTKVSEIFIFVVTDNAGGKILQYRIQTSVIINVDLSTSDIKCPINLVVVKHSISVKVLKVDKATSFHISVLSTNPNNTFHFIRKYHTC